MKNKDLLIWLLALGIGSGLGLLHIDWLTTVVNVVAQVFTRLFQLLAVPTIALAILSTLALFGQQRDTGRLFGRTLTYTLLTTLAATLVVLGLYKTIAPDNLPLDLLGAAAPAPVDASEFSYLSHLVETVPNNLLRPLLEGNVLSVLLIAVAVGIALSRMEDSEGKRALLHLIQGAQDLLFTLIRGLIRVLPLGIAAFAAQLTTLLGADVAVAALGKYVAVILGGNLLQMFVVLPLFLLSRGLNPLRVARGMSPAVVMALLTKSSAATLPVTLASAQDRLGISPRVARFVLPICTTINMNGCAAFILATSLFVMQQGGVEPTGGQLLLWVVLSVISAVGNAGVPMGCYFLTLSLMTGVGAPVAVLGLILPVYAIIDMVETSANVWSDSCVAAMTDADLTRESAS